MLDCYSYKTPQDPQVFCKICKYTSEKWLKFLKYDGYIWLQLYKIYKKKSTCQVLPAQRYFRSLITVLPARFKVDLFREPRLEVEDSSAERSIAGPDTWSLEVATLRLGLGCCDVKGLVYGEGEAKSLWLEFFFGSKRSNSSSTLLELVLEVKLKSDPCDTAD